jgi:protein ImuB
MANQSIYLKKNTLRKGGLDFIALLKAKLGGASVYQPAISDSHIPEKTCSFIIEDEQFVHTQVIDHVFGVRPLWLLREPIKLESVESQPFYKGNLSFTTERERIISGWWDSQEIARDYFMATTIQGVRLWLYKDLTDSDRWYLQGYFD